MNNIKNNKKVQKTKYGNYFLGIGLCLLVGGSLVSCKSVEVKENENNTFNNTIGGTVTQAVGQTEKSTITPKPTAIPAPHVHEWEAVTTTIKHEEEGHWEDVVVQEAWIETIGGSWRTICNGCGTDMTDMEDDEFALHCAIFCQSSYGNRWITNTVEHPAVTEKQWIIDQEAYEETVVTGYKCDCGETK